MKDYLVVVEGAGINKFVAADPNGSPLLGEKKNMAELRDKLANTWPCYTYTLYKIVPAEQE